MCSFSFPQQYVLVFGGNNQGVCFSGSGNNRIEKSNYFNTRKLKNVYLLIYKTFLNGLLYIDGELEKQAAFEETVMYCILIESQNINKGSSIFSIFFFNQYLKVGNILISISYLKFSIKMFNHLVLTMRFSPKFVLEMQVSMRVNAISLAPL